MNVKRSLDYLIGIPAAYVLSLFSFKRAAPERPKKILIIKLAAAGDTILLGTTLKSFRAAHVDATIHWLVSPINVALARAYPHVDEIFVWTDGLKGLPALVRRLRTEKYDAVIDLEQWSRGTEILSYLTGAPVRIGFDTPGQHRTRLFTKTFQKKFDQHEIYDFYGTLALLGELEHNVNLELPVTGLGITQLQERYGKVFEHTGSPKVLIHPGCGWDGVAREWPLENYGVLGHWLIKSCGAELFLSGGSEERSKTQRLKKLLNGAAVDLAGQITWPGLVALVDNVDLVISGNTGVMHVAAARQKKQVALHGPTNPKLWGPLNPNARVVQSTCAQCPCLKLGFEYHSNDASCMRKVAIEDVKNAVLSLIDNKRAI